MKVLKFGGTSVGSVESILSLKQIVEKAAKKQPVVVVVSALGGITDKLIATQQLAIEGNEAWKDSFDAMTQRHHQMIDTIISDPVKREQLFHIVDNHFAELRSLYTGLFLLHDASEKTKCAIVSYGERISSHIVATLINGAKRVDSRDFIKTNHKRGANILASETTHNLVKQQFAELPRITIAPGFISSDEQTGETTNLGRGGSDYTAAIIAAALGAEILEIWTDVDGFMTADPRVIRNAYVLNELSYNEAMELCNFGAKVIYPPTIYPVCVEEIPIVVKNTFNPEAPGTIIKKTVAHSDKVVKGISSIGGTTIVTITGLSMVGVIGVNRRIFTALAENGVSVFMVSQSSSENSTSLCVRDADAEMAREALDREFQKEIQAGSMYPTQTESGLSTIAVVGENMRNVPGIAGKLFGTLGRAGISVRVFAQGAGETNISFVVEPQYLRKALNSLHDAFFLSENKELNLFLCGVGTVGGMLIEQIRTQYSKLIHDTRLKLNVVGIATSHKAIFDRNGIDLNNYRQLLDEAEESNCQKLLDNIISMNIFNSVFVDCTASKEVAGIYQQLLENNINIIAANKVAASGDYEAYMRLKQTALERGVKFRYETNVGAGLPIIGTINDLCNSGDKVLKIEAVLSGTLNFIFNVLSADIPMSQAVRLAKEKGFSEPDPRIDLCGADVIRKIVILTREAGYKIDQEEVEKKLFIPEKFFEGSLDDFWNNLYELDAEFEELRQKTENENKRLRFVATMENGKASVQLKAVDQYHPFYELEGSNNIVSLTTQRYHEFPMLIQGYGAGAAVTAAGVFANIMSIANV